MKQIMYVTLNGLMCVLNKPNDIPSAAKVSITVLKIYLRVTPLTTDITSLNYNTKFNDRTSNINWTQHS